MHKRDTRNWFFPAGAATVAAIMALSCGGSGSPSGVTPPTTTPTPVPTATPGPIVGATCALGKGTVETACGRNKRPLLLSEVDAAIERTARQTSPRVVDVNDQQSSGQYRVIDQKGFINAVVNNLRLAGLCAQVDYDHPLDWINVKNATDFSEDYVLVTSAGYVRRGTGSYKQSCYPSSFPVDPDPSWPPSGSGCTKPYPPGISRFNAKIHLWGPDYVTLDSTAIVGPNKEYCDLIGYTISDLCPVRVTGDPERGPCEEWTVGKAKDTGRYGPTWTFNGEYCKGLAVNGCENHPNDQYALLAAKGGRYVMCGQNGACGHVDVDR
jgi:hypothetical protein